MKKTMLEELLALYNEGKLLWGEYCYLKTLYLSEMEVRTKVVESRLYANNPGIVDMDTSYSPN